MQRSTNPTIDFVSEKPAEHVPDPFLFIDSVARGVCDGLEVAVKKIPRQMLSDDITKLLTQLDHENVLKILAVDDDGTRLSPSGSAAGNFYLLGAEYRYLAMALCEATLDDFCVGKYDGPMPSDLTALNQIANGLKYIHSKGLVHGNIKPTNILISTERPVQLKLSDFGLVESVSKKGILESEKKCCNPFNKSRYWMAFELMEQLLSGDDNSPIQATLNSDIFSTGCLFFYFLTRGIHLYGPPNFIVRNILEGNLINLTQLPKDFYVTTIIVQMVAKKPEDRINIKQAASKIAKKNAHSDLNVQMANDNLDIPRNESHLGRSIFSMKWSEKKKTFRGTFSIVFEASYAGVKVAVKKILNPNLNSNFNDERENILKHLDHPNVLKLYSVVHKLQYKYFAIELCSATLKQYGSGEYHGPIPSEEQGLYQMACGLDYIHSQKLIHRDIKPSNVLISGTKPVQLKWSDFGLSKATDERGTFTPNAPKGTYDWMAPEILRDIMDKSDGLNPATIATRFSDIFSAGCVFFFFLEPPLHPFGHEAQIRFNISEGNPLYLLEKVETSGIAYDFVAKMINPKPEERIPLRNVIEELKSFLSINDSRESEIMTPQYRVKKENELAYREEDQVGQGSFGPFFTDIVQDTFLAVIRVDRSQFAEIAKKEESNWYSIDHENVVRFVAHESNVSFRFYATELHVMSLDELYSDDTFEPKDFWEIPSDHSTLLQLTSGLDFIHSQGLIYYNINPQNVLLCSLSRVKWANQLGLKVEITPKMLEWMAPEILSRNDNSKCHKYCDTFSDIFSAGLVFFFFLTKGVHLFAGGTGTNEILANILQYQKMNLKVLAKESSIVELIDNLTKHDPKLRPCLADVIKILTSSERKLSRLDKEKLSIRYFSDIRNNSPISTGIPTFSSSKGWIHSTDGIFSEIKGVISNTLTSYPSGIESQGNYGGLYVFEGEKVTALFDLGNISILKPIYHPNVIKPYLNTNGGVVVQHCVASLDQLFLADEDIKKYRGPMPTDVQVLFQLASGLDYIHSKDIIHRNIRPENILIVTSTKLIQMKISGFRFSLRYQDLKSNRQFSNHTPSESMNWISPEEKLLIKNSTNSYHTYDDQIIIPPKFHFMHCDTFSCGCVFLNFLLHGIHPFGSTNLVIPANIARGNPVNVKEFPGNHFARPLIIRMIEIDLEKTIPLSQVVDYLKSLLPKDYLNTRNRLSNFYYYGNLNLVHSGPLSSVHHVIRLDGKPMAVKRIPLEASTLSLELTFKLFDELKSLHHPNLVEMFEFDHDRLYRYFSMEFCKVSLDQWFKTNPNAMLHESQFWFQLTSGIRHIHEKHLVHGSIKPSNIFVVLNNDEQQGPLIKLSADFGIIRENQLALLSSNPIWLAPELLEGLMQHSSEQITVVQCTKESDIFAAGNSFFYYWSRGQNLFSKNSQETSETLTNILNGNQVNLFDSTYTVVDEQSQMDKRKGMIRWMTHRDPKERPSLQQITECLPFLKPFPSPTDKLEQIEIAFVDNQQPKQQQTALSTPQKILYSEDHVLGINTNGSSTVFFGFAMKSMDRRSPDWNYGQPVPVAVKRMATVRVKLGKGEILLKTIDEERRDRAKTFMNLNHVNVIRLYSFAKNSKFIVLALEKCRTSLSEYVQKTLFYHGFINMPSDKDVLVQMARGLDYIHSQNLIYRDVKPENVLISETNPAIMKWADFGVSRAVVAGTYYFDQSKFTGTERWLANEIIDTSETNKLFNFALIFGSVNCDTFALGCIFFFYLLSGIHPFGDGPNIPENIKNDNPVNVDRLSREHFASTAIKRMIAKNILMRPKLSDVIICLEKETPFE